MRRYDLFVNPKKDPNARQRERVSEEVVALADEAPMQGSTSQFESVGEYDAEVYFMTGKRTIEKLVREYPDGNYKGDDAENFTMALRSLKVAAETYQADGSWDDAKFAWNYLEEAAQDPVIKSDAKAEKEYCHARLTVPTPPISRR